MAECSLENKRTHVHLEEVGPAFYCEAQTWQPVTAQPPHHQAGKKKQPAAPGGTPSGPLTGASAGALIGQTQYRHKTELTHSV